MKLSGTLLFYLLVMMMMMMITAYLSLKNTLIKGGAVLKICSVFLQLKSFKFILLKLNIKYSLDLDNLSRPVLQGLGMFGENSCLISLKIFLYSMLLSESAP
jgi:hypothetical protein